MFALLYFIQLQFNIQLLIKNNKPLMTANKSIFPLSQTRYNQFDQKHKQIQCHQMQKLISLQKNKSEPQTFQAMQTSKSYFGVSLPHKTTYSLNRMANSQTNSHYKKAIGQKNFNIRGNYSHNFQEQRNILLQRGGSNKKHKKYYLKQKSIKLQLQQQLQQHKKYFSIKNNYDNCIASLHDDSIRVKLQQELQRSKEKIKNNSCTNAEKMNQQNTKNTQIKFYLQKQCNFRFQSRETEQDNLTITNLRFIKPIKLPTKMKNQLKRQSFQHNNQPLLQRFFMKQTQQNQQQHSQNPQKYKFKEEYIKKLNTRQVNRILQRKSKDHKFLEISISPAYQLTGWN